MSLANKSLNKRKVKLMTNHERISAILETIRIAKGAESHSDVMPYVVGMMTAVLNDSQLEAMEEVAQQY